MNRSDPSSFAKDFAAWFSWPVRRPRLGLMRREWPKSLRAFHPSKEHGTPAPVVRMREPLAAGKYCFLPLGSIRPTGWLRNQLEIQANGLGGKGESWERGPYFLDGLIPLAWQLDDARLKAKAQRFMDWTPEHQSANGMIGPASKCNNTRRFCRCSSSRL